MARKVPHEVWLLGVIAALVFGIHAMTAKNGLAYESDFLSPDNMKVVARDTAMLGLFALGTGIIIIAGGIDLSTGSVICFAGVLCAKAPQWISGTLASISNASWCPSFVGNIAANSGLLSTADELSIAMLVGMIALTLLAGIAVGMFHGVLVNKLDLPPFVATLGTMAALRSVASVITTGTLSVGDPKFRVLGNNWYVPVALFVVECLMLGFVMRFTRLGRHIRALGGNEQAARLSGLNVSGLKYFAYTLGAALASLAGIVYLANVGNATSQTGVGYELDAIAATVVGGCNLRGGSGSIFGIVLGVALLQIVMNGTLFVISQNATEWRGLIVGCVVILAVLFGKLGAKT